MLEAGELTPQEFEIVRRKLGRKISNKEAAPPETPAGLTPSMPDSPPKEPPEGDTPSAFPPNNDDIAKS
jgi:hypothetical protein